jgi:hypothetical protein
MMRTLQLGTVFSMLAIGTLTGCAHAPTQMYQWEGYQRIVYEYLKHETANPSEQLNLMQTQAEKARVDGKQLPPGFRAQVAILQLQLGQFDNAKQQLEAEKTAFPESSHYMDFLLKQMSEKKS